jgi:metal-responsive CopG/Arc/MetJ family transcriptional regulator
MAGKEKVTLSLPSELMAQVRELAPERGQSEFIAEAITYYLSARQRRALRERLVAGYQALAAEDAALAGEWRAADDEAWLDEVPIYEVEETGDGPTDPPR